MSQERLAPDALLDTDLTGPVSYIQDDPDNPDSNWLTTTDNNSDHYARVSFGTPTATPAVGANLQEFRALVRKYGGTGTPTARIELWENGNLIRAGSENNITGPTVIAFTWNANELSISDGSQVECRVYGTKTGGSPTSRASVEIGAIEWNCAGAGLYYQSAYGSFDFGGIAGKFPKKRLAGSLVSSGAVSKLGSFYRSLAGTLDSVGSITKKSTRFLTGVFYFSGTLAGVRAFFKSLTGAFGFAGAVIKLPKKGLTGTFGFAGTTVKKTIKSFAGALTFVGNLATQLFGGLIQKSVGGILTFSGIIQKKSTRTLAGVFDFTGSILKKTFKALVGTLTSTGDLLAHKIGGLIQKSVGGILTFTGNLQRSKLGEVLAAIYQIVFRRRRRK